MRYLKLNDMVKGWFAGNFEPTAFQTEQFESGVKMYEAGDAEERHHHKIATEITVVASGQVEMNGQLFKTGDIIVIEPGESTDFRALEKSVTVVVKVPSVIGDKYPGDAQND